MDELFDQVLFGEARGGRKPTAPLAIEAVRSLTREDLPQILEGSKAPQQLLVSGLRHSHHQLARLIAQGMEQEQVSYITGYSPAYISRIKNEDPAFKDLVAYYTKQREQIFVDVVERMRVLGLNFVEELAERLEKEPTKFSNREIGEMIELLAVKPMIAQAKGFGPAGGPAGGVNINVKFVSANRPAPEGPIIDLQAESAND